MENSIKKLDKITGFIVIDTPKSKGVGKIGAWAVNISSRPDIEPHSCDCSSVFLYSMRIKEEEFLEENLFQGFKIVFCDVNKKFSVKEVIFLENKVMATNLLGGLVRFDIKV